MNTYTYSFHSRRSAVGHSPPINRSGDDTYDTGSSNGRTPGFGPGYLGSSPSPVALAFCFVYGIKPK